ncbi:MAG: DUF2314 domain-containing protein [Deltaproteobacteria bacterium]|nr:DUF2314 domain-containing protein [Deltaproteobacteria bacterium]
MAARAQKMLSVLRQVSEELAEFEPGVLVKLGYRMDGGGETDREHLWFEVHGFQGDSVDATLTNAPFYIARLQQGARGLHPLELLSDWAVFTPFGRVDPRQTRTLRFIRANRERLREVMVSVKAKAANPG